MTETMDWNTLVLNKFENLSADLHDVRSGLTQLATESASIVKMLGRVEASIEKLEARDDAQQERIDELRLNQHRLDTAVVTLTTLGDDCSKTVHKLEQKAAMLNDGDVQLDRRVRVLETDVKALTVDQEEGLAFHEKWEPWLSVMRWVVVGVGGVVLAAVAVWLLRDVATSILGP